MFLNRLNGQSIGVSVLGIFVIDKNTILAVSCLWSIFTVHLFCYELYVDCIRSNSDIKSMPTRRVVKDFS